MVHINIESIDNAETWEYTSISNNYYVSTYGRIYSIKSQKILSQYKDSGYNRVTIHDKNSIFNKRSVKVHKIVAETFLKKHDKNYVIDHIDRDKTNNKLSNLRYVSISDNNRNRDVKGCICVTPSSTYRVYYVKITGERISKCFKELDLAKTYLEEIQIIYKR